MTTVEERPIETTVAPEGASARAVYRRATRTGAISAGGAFVGLLALNGITFFGTTATSDFYGAQARAWLNFRWNMPKSVLGIEAFAHNGRWYMYYGPFPSLLRLPLVIVGFNLSSRVSQLSMLLAFVVAMLAISHLLWTLRTIVRPGAPITEVERLVVSSTVLLLGAGSVLSFLASRVWVYHEAEIWGAALALAAFAATLDVVLEPSRRGIVLAGALAAASVLSRASVGLGPIVALLLLAFASASAGGRRIAGMQGERDRREPLRFAAAGALPMVAYAAVNYAKFGSLFVFPTAAQWMSQVNPQRKLFLARSGGSYFSLQFIPTTFKYYIQPFGLRLSPLFPFIDFPSSTRAVGGTVFDAIEPTASIPSSMPAITLLAAIGLGALLTRRWRAPLAPLRMLVIGGAVGASSVLPFGYIAPRYLSDFLPFLALPALAAVQLLLAWHPRDRANQRRRRLVWSTIGVLGVASIATTVALTIQYHYANDWNTEDVSAPFVRAQYALHDAMGIGTAPKVERGDRLPYPPRPRGTVFVLGDCRAVYWSPGDVRSLAWNPWQAVGRTRAAGEYRLRMRVDDQRKAVIEPVVVRGDPGQVQMVAVRVQRGRLRFLFSSQGHDSLPRSKLLANRYFTGPPVEFSPRRWYDVTVTMDPNSGAVSVRFDGRNVFRFRQVELTPEQHQSYVFPTDRVAIGRNNVGAPAATTFAGAIVERTSVRPSICKYLADQR